MKEELSDHLVSYITEALDSRRNQTPPPSNAGMTDEELGLADSILRELEFTEPREIEPVPLSEDRIAITLGLVDPPPAVAVDTRALAAVLADVDKSTLSEKISSYGHTCDEGFLGRLETGAITELSPHLLRTLAALLDVEPGELALQAIEPFPVESRHDLEARLEQPWQTELHNESLCVASPDHRLGVLIAHIAHPDQLSSLNVRRTAWELLTSVWLHHSACLVVSPIDSWMTVVVDAIDCHPHHNAPTGSLTYGPSLEPLPLVDTLDTYSKRFHISWHPPEQIPVSNLDHDLIVTDASRGLQALLRRKFQEPKRTAFHEVADELSNVDTSDWRYVLRIDQGTAANEAEAVLGELVSHR